MGAKGKVVRKGTQVELGSGLRVGMEKTAFCGLLKSLALMEKNVRRKVLLMKEGCEAKKRGPLLKWMGVCRDVG